ncbi:MAG: molecular chaperone DnaJ [Candidatus Micrarchaeota archaeon]
MSEKRDYYDVLGLSKSAGADDVKSAYKRLAKEYHPDVSKDPKAKEKFQEVLEAYSVLSDGQKRQNYDQFGHAAEGFSGYSGGGFGGFGGAGMDFDFSELFENFGGFEGFGSFADIFGGQSRRSRGSAAGENLRVDLMISLRDAASGASKEIEVHRTEKCESCSGSGSEQGSSRETCSTCRGHGVVQNSQRTPFGIFSVQTTCPKCKGQGTVIKNPCKICKGKGIQKNSRKIEVRIPAGIETGMHLRLNEEGNASSSGGKNGDLFVVVFVETDEVFKRDGVDLFVESALSFAEAALGTNLRVPTLNGHASVKIPAGTQTGTIFRLKGEGVKDLKTGRKGDEFVKVMVVTPSKLSKEERELFEKLGKNGVAQKREGIFDKLKKGL